MTDRLRKPRRDLVLAAAVYGLSTLVMLLFAASERWSEHTPYNHFALLAEAWLDGRLDLGGPPPGYAAGNDFAYFAGRHYVVFPPFPALVLVPFVALAGGAEALPDGLVFLFLAGVGPAVFFLALEKLRLSAGSERSERENLALALLFAFGSVYFFSAVQGTVWFAAHVVGVALGALYVLFALGAERPWLAGVALALGFATRAPLLFALPLFVFEAVRAAEPEGAVCILREPFAYAKSLRYRRLFASLARFATPLAFVVLVTFAHNRQRFGSAFDFGYEHLTVVWRGRIEAWGLFDYHYLGRNLGVMLAGLPWVPGATTPFQIGLHGLALWVTTPLYFLLWKPRRHPAVAPGLVAAAVGAALPSLFYQNTGWVQFGYRFSNDYALFLFALIAVGGRPLTRGALPLAILSVAVNAFGAWTFDRADYAAYYSADPRAYFQPD